MSLVMHIGVGMVVGCVIVIGYFLYVLYINRDCG